MSDRPGPPIVITSCFVSETLCARPVHRYLGASEPKGVTHNFDMARASAQAKMFASRPRQTPASPELFTRPVLRAGARIRLHGIAAIYLLAISAMQATSQAAPQPVPPSISGHVLNRLAEPIPATVQALELVARDGHMDIYPECSTDTAPDGSFQCRGLPTGKFIVEVQPATTPKGSSSTKGTQPAGAYPGTLFYPNTTDFDHAEPVRVVRGMTTWCDFQLTPTGGWTISGQLPTLIPRNAELRLKAIRGHLTLNLPIHVRVDPKTGAIAAHNAPDGNFEVIATWISSGVLQRALSTVTVDERDGQISPWKQTPLVVVQGTFALAHDMQIGHISLYRCDDSQQKVSAAVKDGAFSLPPIPAGEYFLGLPINQDSYIAAVTSHGTRTPYSRLLVTADQPTDKILVETRRPGAQIKGNLADWSAGDSPVQIVLLSEDSGQAFTAPADRQGLFSLIGIPPGSYQLYAWPLKDDAEYRNPTFQQRHKQEGISLSVDAGATKEMDDVAIDHSIDQQ